MFELFLVGLTFAVYSLSMRGKFLFSDDDSNIAQPRFRYAWAYLRSATHVSYWVNLKLGGKSPASFHAGNTLLHALNAVLLLHVGMALDMPYPAAHLAATVYVLHPLCVSAVAYISGRAMLLSTSFMLGAILAALTGYWWAIVPLYGLAVLAKEDAAILPFTLGLLLLALGRREGWFVLFLPVPLAFYRVRGQNWMRYLMNQNYVVNLEKGGHGETMPIGDYRRALFAESALRFPQWFVGQGLNPDPDFRAASSRRVFMAWTVLAAAAGLAVGINHPLLWVALILIVVSPWLVYFVVQMPDMFENRAYFAASGMALLWGIALSMYPVSWLAATVTVAILAFFAIRTTHYAGCWDSELDLWTFAMNAGSSKKYRVLFNMGRAHIIRKNYDQAEYYLRQGLLRNPGSAIGWGNLAKVYADTGRDVDATRCLVEAVTRCPEFGQAWAALAMHQEKMGEPDIARTDYEMAVRFGCDEYYVWHRLGVLYFQGDRMPEAHHAFKRCVELKPLDPVFEYDYAMACMAVGEKDEGMAHLDHVPASLFLKMMKVRIGVE